METWGSWTFHKENERLLSEVLNKFETDQSNLDSSRKAVLSSLAANSKTRVEISSSSTDDSDVDNDFNAVLTCMPKNCTVENEEPIFKTDETIVHTDFDTFDGESSFLSQRQQPSKQNHENITKVIIELLNNGNCCNLQELCSLLTTEQKNRKDVSEIIRNIWPELVTDKARHGLCELLVKTNVRPHIICEQIYTPWLKICESNLTGFIESLSKLIIHFPEYACKCFIVKLLNDKDSILVKHIDWLVEIMKSLDQQNWCNLLNEYMKSCDSLGQHEIMVLLHLVKNCQKSLDENEAKKLVLLCRNAVHEHSANREFALFLTAVIGAVDITKFRPEMTTICAQLKGASKFLIMKALKDAK
ncbi:Hypothetical protein CINCED_3A024146 [Cinara cedri]|uniref:Fanconi Anaemia group E protein C-terminal domain-containing protein n=1 Tax=Cinara cedri TaxID=506608 RepID=A0A5E4N5I3_9HEMI|nr:Hypothetical protein CINCED_3A024146 [Cinara cedri]